MKILFGGIPLGCDNIGDEAILAGGVAMLRRLSPGAEIAVATADAATAARLGVETIPAYGFAGIPLDGFADAVKGFDAYVWGGATGLSDYPDTALDLLETAQEAGVATFVWAVGMDDELNPVFFRAHGKKAALLGLFGLTGAYEKRLRKRLARRLARVLPRCRGVWVRDPQSRDMLARTGFSAAEVAVDCAVRDVAGLSKPRKRLGLCISAQRRVADLDGVREMADSLRAAGWEVVGLAMNPKTDRAILEGLGIPCEAADTPEGIEKAAGACAAVVSSRLHLLILAANAGTPGVGVARGSKIANWLANFGDEPAGSVQSCDWARVAAKALALGEGAGRAAWEETRRAAYARLAARRAAAEAAFAGRLAKVAEGRNA